MTSRQGKSQDKVLIRCNECQVHISKLCEALHCKLCANYTHIKCITEIARGGPEIIALPSILRKLSTIAYFCGKCKNMSTPRQQTLNDEEIEREVKKDSMQ